MIPETPSDEELLRTGKRRSRNLDWGERIRLQKLRSEATAKKAAPLKAKKVRKMVKCPHCGRLMLKEVRDTAKRS